MRHTIHVHQLRMRRGESAIIDRTYKGSTHSRKVTILCPSCHTPAATVVQSEKPDSCGARIWINATEVAHEE